MELIRKQTISGCDTDERSVELMKRFADSLLRFSALATAILLLHACSGVQPTAKPTSTGGPAIEQVQKEDYMGPKARVAVTKFLDKSAKGQYTGQIGDGMAEMLANALFTTNRYIVLERQSLDEVIREQDLGASGRVRTETAPKIGEIEGADLLIEGTITEFEPGSSGAGGGLAGFSRKTGILGGILGGVRNSHVAMIVKVIDARTGRRLASEQLEGKATDIGGIGGLGGSGLAGVFGAYSKTPMEKAIRIAIEESVKLIVAKTPPEYYRVSGKLPLRAAATPPAKTPETPKPAHPPQASPPTASLQPQSPAVKPAPPPARMTQVAWPAVNLRGGPGTNFKIVKSLKKGDSLAILEEKGDWFHVRLEDGSEAWVTKAATTDAPKKAPPAPPAPPSPPKPKPM
jgi:curli biogenesis system outer membrane secretion channel CsgG